MFFGFTNCPDVCPNTLGKLAKLRRDLGQGDGAFDIVFVSVDPQRDTPKVVGDYVDLFGTPIINQPQVAILEIGTVEKRVVAVNDALAIRPMMHITLGFDHRGCGRGDHVVVGVEGRGTLRVRRAHTESRARRGGDAGHPPGRARDRLCGVDERMQLQVAPVEVVGLCDVDSRTATAAGELVAFPTETVYGLGADASSAAAMKYSVAHWIDMIPMRPA